MTGEPVAMQDAGGVQHDMVGRALAGKFLVAPHEANHATKEELRRLARDGKLAFVNGGWTKP